MRSLIIPALQPPLNPITIYDGVVILPAAPTPVMAPLAVNPGSMAIADPSTPLSPAKPL